MSDSREVRQSVRGQMRVEQTKDWVVRRRQVYSGWTRWSNDSTSEAKAADYYQENVYAAVEVCERALSVKQDVLGRMWDRAATDRGSTGGRQPQRSRAGRGWRQQTMVVRVRVNESKNRRIQRYILENCERGEETQEDCRLKSAGKEARGLS